MDFYKMAIDSSFDGILITDAKGTILYANQQYEEITKLKTKMLIGAKLQDLLDKKIINKAISLEVLKTGKTVSTLHKYSTGESALSSAQPIFNENSEIIGVINNTRNIDDLVALQEEIEKHKAHQERNKMVIKQLKEIINSEIDFIYASEEMEKTIALAYKVAPFDTTVVIYGESGTGKEVLSRYIHEKSTRSNHIFIKVNCAAIPRELFESELFGYEKGAFTGASSTGKIGLFELANGGTLFLDEIGELNLEVQSKLLRAIQEKEIMRIGGKERIPLDIRIIGATNKNLKEESEKGNFREDLYFRLNVFPITIEPLRRRPKDIPILIEFFTEKLNKKYKTDKRILKETMDYLVKYDFPGNVRELENMIEYLFVICERDIPVEAIPGKILSQIMISDYQKGISNNENVKLPHLVALYEKTIIEDAMAKYHTLEEAAKVLGIHYSTLSRKLHKYGLA